MMLKNGVKCLLKPPNNMLVFADNYIAWRDAFLVFVSNYVTLLAFSGLQTLSVPVSEICGLLHLIELQYSVYIPP